MRRCFPKCAGVCGVWRMLILAVLWLASQVGAGDIVASAADGSLWNLPLKELVIADDALFHRAKYRMVDADTLRLLGGDGALLCAGLETGDIVMQLTEDHAHVCLVSTTFYNKGDDGVRDKAQFESLLSSGVESISACLNTAAKQRKTDRRETGVRARAWEWTTPNCAVLLEASSSGSGKRYVAEFIRLIIAPNKEALERGGAADGARKDELKDNVSVTEDGSVIISGVPMVDQGEKGYCVPAAVARVFAYYGMNGVDQHALAALCKSSGRGTTLPDMEKALVSISAPFHMIVTSWEWISPKYLSKIYSRKSQKMREDSPETLMKIFEDNPALMQKGFASIRKYIDQGIPVIWGVILGIFPEKGIPQSIGGHMRLIIGYNEKNQTLFYTDSWGVGHELKSMPLTQACPITRFLGVLRPRR